MKVLLLENIHALAQEAFRAAGFLVETLPRALDPHELKEKLRDVHILGIRSKTQITAESLSHADELLAIGCFCIGTNQVDISAAQRKGIPVFNAPFGNTRSVAEMIIAEIIVLSRQIGQRTIEMHQKIWRKVSQNCFEVRGKTLGIVGYGHIGSQVSTLAESLGMRILYFDIISKLPLGNAKICSTLHELLTQSDFVTLHVPATQLTHRMISEPELQVMKKGSYLINASRGSVVDIQALSQALQNQHLAGAAIDVFPEEPEANSSHFVSELQGLNNTLLTPHIGGATEEAQVNIGTEVPAALIRFIQTGSTSGAVHFPQVDLIPTEKSYRILNIHKNVPGVLRDINQIISDWGSNILGQTLATNADLGYLILDMNQALPEEIKKGIENLPFSIRTRILYEKE